MNVLILQRWWCRGSKNGSIFFPSVNTINILIYIYLSYGDVHTISKIEFTGAAIEMDQCVWPHISNSHIFSNNILLFVRENAQCLI